MPSSFEESKILLNGAGAAKHLGFSTVTFYKMIRSGKLVVQKILIGKRSYYLKLDLDTFILKNDLPRKDVFVGDPLFVRRSISLGTVRGGIFPCAEDVNENQVTKEELIARRVTDFINARDEYIFDMIIGLRREIRDIVSNLYSEIEEMKKNISKPSPKNTVSNRRKN